MASILIKNATAVNEGQIFQTDLLINNGRIEKMASNLDGIDADQVIDATGKHLFPGVIDDQVHFREPGLTHKAEIYTEAKSAVAGGTTTFMEMPNTKPQALTQELLADKYAIAKERSLANYSFFMGVSNDNLEEALKTDPKTVCGLKIFMGSSTGNMLVDNKETLEAIFSKAKLLIATHCEDEETVRGNEKIYKEKYGEDMPIHYHAEIRSVEACYKSSSMAMELAKKHNTRLHILHISTAEELALFDNTTPLKDKRITSEVCVHHLWFDRSDYEKFGTQVKCNPAVKEAHHKAALLEGLLNDKLDIIATDHAPHTKEEKASVYWNAPSGVPLVSHSLYMMLEFYKEGKLSLEKIVEKMCHAPAECFEILERGYLREGYWADLVLVDLNDTFTVAPENIHYKCKWSPFEGHTFPAKVSHTIVSGHIAYENGQFNEEKMGERVLFDR
ncbi:MAG: dihydroorotase [Flammeovirgaceae bacterium]